jgi:hypothetical protein
LISGIPCYFCVVKRNDRKQACDELRFGV